MAKTREKSQRVTPLMKQYNAIKAKYPGTILLFRVGDFYETFLEDAVQTSQTLGIVLTKRSNGAASEIELAGFPHHSLDTYITKLVRAGHRVAVCDQLEDPKLAKGIVKRGVTEILTPGLAMSDKILDQKTNNYLASVFYYSKNILGLAMMDVSTGDFFCLSGDIQRIEKLLFSLRPNEILLPRKDLRGFKLEYGDEFYTFRLEDWVYDLSYAQTKLMQHFKVHTLKGFGLEDETAGSIAAGVILHYLQENEQKDLKHINSIYVFEDSGYLSLDKYSIRNLELLRPIFLDGYSFLDTIDKTHTAMGARLLKKWISFPLRNIKQIEQRQQMVASLIANKEAQQNLTGHLKGVSDIERILAKLSTFRISPRECLSLKHSLMKVIPINECLESLDTEGGKPALQRQEAATEAIALLEEYINPDAPANTNTGQYIREGLHAELDEIRNIRSTVGQYLEDFKAREVERTGISSMKVSFNKVFGYYIEVTHTHKDKVPEEYIRKQTLTAAERYITPELKEFEDKILNAEEKIHTLEKEIYTRFIVQLQAHIVLMQQNAYFIAQLDILVSFSILALKNNYCRPQLNDGHTLHIIEGRHPVIEQLLPADSSYIPNDVYLDNEESQILIITGPNMAGKSALLRQVALVVIMAQMGSYVPAQSAEIGLVDKVFTRIGAADNVSAGESTFMVEMTETARILNNATESSLILLDEVGRGTSTYDGVSIAWALIEYLHNTPSRAAKTLFATHYHELAELATQLDGVKNYNVSVKEVDGKIIFMRKLQEGSSEHSFGIQVAEMAGVPHSVIQRATDLLLHFENSHTLDQPQIGNMPVAPTSQVQIKLFNEDEIPDMKARDILENIDVNRLTPVEALLKLMELKQLYKKK